MALPAATLPDDMDTACPGPGGRHMPDYLRHLTLAKDEGAGGKGRPMPRSRDREMAQLAEL